LIENMGKPVIAAINGHANVIAMRFEDMVAEFVVSAVFILAML